MPGNTINFELKLNSNIGEETTAARGLSRELGVAAKAAQNIEYGRGRGIMGSTGASARDFANQAQGLGGLVRLYATVAANTFAATAAFNTLKEAADTTALREGLNQLGASSGIALGSLAKGFVDATDGAVSFRDAAQAASKATSAGLSSRQFLQIGEYAKKASQALGVDMNDAVSRLTRGIVKLEPELLDELGIFTKIGPAVEEYARKLGKTESSLTDYERRQAFAIAVLEEARKKYAEINIPTNPYTKLLATLKDVTQAGLELINKFLAPIASLFANNSALVVAAIAAIGAKLIGMGIPALQGWSKQLKDSADRAKEYASTINEVYGKKLSDKIDESFNIPQLTNKLRTAEQAYIKSQQILTQTTEGESKKRAILAYKETDLTGKNYKNISRSINSEIRKLEALGSDPAATAEVTKRAQQEIDMLRTKKAAIQDVVRANRELAAASEKALAVADQPKLSFGEMIRSRISSQATARAERMDIVAGVGGTVDRAGFMEAISEMNKKIADSTAMRGWDKFRTRVSGTFAAATASVSNFLAAFGPWGQVAAVAAAGLGVIDGWLSKATKQFDEFTRELSRNQDTIENSAAVIKKYGGVLSSTEAISAYGTSIGELSDGIDALAKKFTNLAEKQSPWENFKQGILSFFGASAAQDFADTVAQNWMKQIQMLPEGELKSAAIKKLQDVFNIAEVTQESLKGAIQKGKVAENIRAGQEAIKPAQTQVRELGLQAAATKDAITQLQKSSQDLQNTFLDNNPITKWALDLMKASLEIQKSFKDISTTLAAFKEVLSKPAAFALIDRQALMQYEGLVKSQDIILKNDQIIRNQEEKLIPIRKQLDNLLKLTGGETLSEQEYNRITGRGPGGTMAAKSTPPTRKQTQMFEAGRLQETLRQGEEIIARTKQDNDRIQAQGLKDLWASINEKFKEAWIQGYNLLTKSVELANKQGILQINKSIMSGVTGPGTAQATFEITKQDIQLQREQLQISKQLVDALELNALAQQDANYLRERSELTIKRAGEGLSPIEQMRLENVIQGMEELATYRGMLKSGNKFFTPEQATKLQPEVGGLVLKNLGIQRGYDIQAKAQDVQDRINQFNLEINLLRENRAIQSELLSDEGKRLDLRGQISKLQQLNLDYISEESLKVTQALDVEKQLNIQKQQRYQLDTEIAVITEKIRQQESLGKDANQTLLTTLRTNLQTNQERRSTLEGVQALEKNILNIQQEQERIAARFAKAAQDRAQATFLADKAAEIKGEELSLEQKLLEYSNSRGRLTADEYTQRKLGLDLRILELETINKQRQAEQTRAEAIAKIEQEYQSKTTPGDETADQIAQYIRATEAVKLRYSVEMDVIKRTNDMKKQGIMTDALQTDRMKNYEDTFKRAFDGMADAIINWAETGKLASKDLFKNLLTDIARYELKLQTMQLWSAARDPLMRALFGTNLGPEPSASQSAAIGTGPLQQAIGGVYDKGIRMFAKGGMFTNSIVNQPTLFKFASGAGLMGEAGPEAIMPLKRDSSGNLGVRSNSQKTEVIINNYSGERAETVESTDSRGNRKVEVIIGEAAAGEMGRSGSSTQRAMRSTYGLRPQLIRR